MQEHAGIYVLDRRRGINEARPRLRLILRKLTGPILLILESLGRWIKPPPHSLKVKSASNLHPPRTLQFRLMPAMVKVLEDREAADE